MPHRKLLIVGATGRIDAAVWSGLKDDYEILGTSRRVTPADALRGLHSAKAGGTGRPMSRSASATA